MRISKTYRLPWNWREYVPAILAAAWLLFTLSMTSWWLLFGLRQIERLKMIEGILGIKWLNQQRMMIWEGSFLLLILALGGAALFSYTVLEFRRKRSLQNFVASFTHDIKTSLASLRLQAEVMQEDFPQQKEYLPLQRLLKDINRLEVQLENVLRLSPQNRPWVLTPVNLEEFLKQKEMQWPQLSFVGEVKTYVMADPAALETIFKNIFQNASHHAQAKHVYFQMELKTYNSQKTLCSLYIHNDGLPFQGNSEHLGAAFFRHQAQSGSGLGLYTIAQLMTALKGRAHFKVENQTLKIELCFLAGEQLA